MIKKMLGVLLAMGMFALSGCDSQKKEVIAVTAPSSTMLDEISGVWRAQSENTLMTIQYADHKVRLLFGDDFIPVTVGAIDDVNKTVNFNVILAATGKPAVWTVREIWNEDKSSFHLQLTLHDGTQEDFGFVRKISTDDLNHIASLEPQQTRTDSTAQTAAAAAAPATSVDQQQQAQPVAVAASATPPAINTVSTVAVPVSASTDSNLALATQTAAAPVQSGTFAPSFDCAKVSTGPERLVCGSQQLSALDVQLAQAYKRNMSLTDDTKALKDEQIEWRKKARDACSTVECMAQAYQSRIDDLDAVSSHLSKPKQFQ
ncbi:lysozyme inhibitor LprI family protein [Paraburkholderia sp. CNPSo 3272]|uniref:lysozyme inhibitor LprI family protein n=1 Tax=Paraburkholderia sp. CNPSo 3272 TaxID=2940931 RepID=UPI0020B686CE|nr:lysozyme inhibitor LprI family protein [Paraburkholderia sp. CNPSo 3272]MCP3727472.1 lysozyme inhibitor LprI family protein [Paraburkholderia sp. CNPSo 3272]